MEPENPERQFLLEEYRARINRVMDHIEKNLDRELALEELARVAGFSRFHFHRLFSYLVGETLFQFIQRLRLEKAGVQLLLHPCRSVTEIAFECGFSGSTAFARSFRAWSGVSATDWRRGRHQRNRKPGETKSKPGHKRRNDGQAGPASSMYIGAPWRVLMNKPMHEVEVKELPELTVAYVRHTGPYKGDAQLFERLYSRLFRWAGPRDLLRFPQTQSLIIYHDSPEITPEEKLRVSCCITVPPGTEVGGEIGKMAIPAGRYAMARFELGNADYQGAWDWVFGTWLPQSGYVPDDGPCFELYHGDPKEHPEGKATVDICLAVRPM